MEGATVNARGILVGSIGIWQRLGSNAITVAAAVVGITISESVGAPAKDAIVVPASYFVL